MLPYCENNGFALLAYYPLGHGKLTEDPKIDGVASKCGKTRSQIALSWLARRDNVSQSQERPENPGYRRMQELADGNWLT
jgi:diketogulonate reductase-like aldo/keto reductase